MSFLPPEGPAPELSTARVGSGRSARVMAVAVAGMLVAIVGFTVANRPLPPGPPVPTAPAIAIVPTPAPTPAPPRNQLEGNDGITGWAVVAQLPYYAPPDPAQGPVALGYAVGYETPAGTRAALLEPKEHADGTLQTSHVIEDIDLGVPLDLRLGRIVRNGGVASFQEFAAWLISLKAIRKSDQIVTLLVEHVPTSPTLPSGNAVLAPSGYTFTLTGHHTGTQLALHAELVWSSTSFAEYGGARGPGLFNRCRWGDGPQAATAHGDQDEAGCLEG